jgi:hypothetical protein
MHKRKKWPICSVFVYELDLKHLLKRCKRYQAVNNKISKKKLYTAQVEHNKKC